jgi:hypothetical protein
VLFFNDAEILVGAQQLPGFICLSGRAESANEATSADGAKPVQFAFVDRGRATAEFWRWAKYVT